MTGHAVRSSQILLFSAVRVPKLLCATQELGPANPRVSRSRRCDLKVTVNVPFRL